MDAFVISSWWVDVRDKWICYNLKTKAIINESRKIPSCKSCSKNTTSRELGSSEQRKMKTSILAIDFMLYYIRFTTKRFIHVIQTYLDIFSDKSLILPYFHSILLLIKLFRSADWALAAKTPFSALPCLVAPQWIQGASEGVILHESPSPFPILDAAWDLSPLPMLCFLVTFGFWLSNLNLKVASAKIWHFPIYAGNTRHI